MNGIVPIDRIKEAVAEVFALDRGDLECERRAKHVARPRQIAMFLCRQFTRRSLPDIGRAFGGRDHTTVMHACKRIEQLTLSDPDVSQAVARLRATLTVAGLTQEGVAPEDILETMREARIAAIRRVKLEPEATLSGPASALRRGLQEAFGERLMATCAGKEGFKTELLVSPEGTWTLLEIGANGSWSRVAACGTGWSSSVYPRPKSIKGVSP